MDKIDMLCEYAYGVKFNDHRFILKVLQNLDNSEYIDDIIRYVKGYLADMAEEINEERSEKIDFAEAIKEIVTDLEENLKIIKMERRFR